MLNKAQKQQVLDTLCALAPVTLQCDAYKILLVPQVYQYKITVNVFVNGWFKGEWVNSTSEAEESKFLPTYTRSILSPRTRLKLLKQMGRRAALNLYPELNDKLTFRKNWFGSPAVALRHLCKVSESISLVDD